MKPNTPSRTAQYMALFRAVETTGAEATRLFTDKLAFHFLDTGLQAAVKFASLPFVGGLIPWYINQKGIGAISSGIARTKYIDDLLVAAVNAGTKQVIVLGAGFDTRAIRLNLSARVAFIEIDHPDTSKYKQRVLKTQLGKLPDNIAFEQADFNRQSIEEIAEQAKINFSAPTTVIWEGVTNYLTPAAIESTFAFTRKFSKPFSIIFTYIDKAVLENPASFEGTECIFANLQKNEEKWTFGFNPDEIAAFLYKYGLTLKEDLNAAEYRSRYMPERKAFSRGYEFYRVVFAERC